MEKRRSLQGYLLVFMSGVSWGLGGYLVTQMSNMGVSSLMTAFSGHFIALLPLFLYLIVKKGMNGLKISKRGLLYSILLGALTKGIFKLANDTAVTLVGVAAASILMYLAPVFTAIMSVIFFKEKLRGYQHFAVLLNLVGCILMVTGGNFAELNISGLGLTLGVISGFLYALNTIIGKVATDGDDPETMTFYMLLFSAMATSIFAKPWQHLDLFTNSTFLFWAFLNSMSTGLIANLLYLKGLSMGVDASKATIIASGEVVIATLSGVFLLNEKINFIGSFGIVIMLISIVLMNITIPTKQKEVTENEIVSS
ncbi:drug/metabolite transporter (DMT)-like permease [Alkalibaculum bacchi]|uniref:Drug/metabolite transporter (DMT)-like permease n=1 Tax=Alkalibaculum bacchi TaxID=645887 RepID=A0A366I119_9FIRM|nr:DMT family transporter [Alkalibaculum bacchi]RBP61036.1 drug/metabolite transporter (DMT)-like permease [Alkalibaculum bacchi]